MEREQELTYKGQAFIVPLVTVLTFADLTAEELSVIQP